MSYYQAHVQRLCAAMGVGMSVNGCPVLSRECTPAILDFGAVSAALSLVWKPKNNEFTNTVVAAMMEAAVGILLENAPSNPKRHLAQDPDAYPIPVQVRVAQQDAIRTVYKTTVSALLYKGADRQNDTKQAIMESVADAVQSVVREYWLQHGREKDKEEKRVSLLRERFAHDLAARMAVWKDEKAAEIESCERALGHYQHLSERQALEIVSLRKEAESLQRQLDATKTELEATKLSRSQLAAHPVPTPDGDDVIVDTAIPDDCAPVIWSGVDLSRGISLRARRRISRIEKAGLETEIAMKLSEATLRLEQALRTIKEYRWKCLVLKVQHRLAFDVVRDTKCTVAQQAITVNRLQKSIHAAIATRVIHVAAEVTSEVKQAVVDNKPKRVSIKRSDTTKPVILERRDSARAVATKLNHVALSTQEAVFVTMPHPSSPNPAGTQSTKGAKGKFFANALSRRSVGDVIPLSGRPVTPATDCAARTSPLPSLQLQTNGSRPLTANGSRPGTGSSKTQPSEVDASLPPSTIPSEAVSPVSHVTEWESEISASEPEEPPSFAQNLPLQVVPLSAKASFRELLLGRCASRHSMKAGTNDGSSKLLPLSSAQSSESAFRKVLSPVAHNRRASAPESSSRLVRGPISRPSTPHDATV